MQALLAEAARVQNVSMILRHLPNEFRVVPGRLWGWIEGISFPDAAGPTISP